MKILVIGSGGREHTLVWKIRQSERVEKIYCAPGNGGIAGMTECVNIKTEDIKGLLQFAQKNKIDLTVVGPEGPLAAGIVDEFRKNDLMIFGPAKEAARLEGSKVFAKEFMQKYHIPTAEFQTFSDATRAINFLKGRNFPMVIKADGLAAGKGVVIANSFQEAKEAVDQIMTQKIFKEAGSKIVIEECLEGEEASILAVSDGSNFVLLDSAQDHKRIFDGDLGPNTGGMGAYSPAPVVTKDLMKAVALGIVMPVIQGMKKEGHAFTGVLYVGLMMTTDGPQVLEFNVRFGDPETQAILPRMKNDLVEIMLASCEAKIHQIRLDWDRRACVCVVMSSRGYPGHYEKGKEITGLEAASGVGATVIFHAGTEKQNGKIITSGGRVLGVTSLGSGIEEAIETVYQAVEKIKFDGCFFRRDIGAKALQRR